MCIICTDFQKGLLTATEAARNYYEMVTTLEPEHAEKLADEIQVALFREAVEREQNAKV